MQNQNDLMKVIMGEFERMKKEYDVDLPNANLDELENIFGIPLDDLNSEISNITKKHKLKIQKISEDAVIPKYAYESDSGFDLHSNEELTLPPFGRALIPTGLRFGIPYGTEVQIRPKSGLAINQGLTVLNSPGTVDQGYNGEIKVILFNASSNSVTIKKGMKIAQAVVCPVFPGAFISLEEVKDLDETDRGENGFGSTGLNL